MSVPAENSNQPRARKPRRWGWLLISGVVCAALVVLVGPYLAAWWARRSAERELEAGAIAAAEQWLDWGARYDAEDGAADLIRATCFRHAGQREDWATARVTAERHGAAPTDLALERRLGEIRWGSVAKLETSDFDALLDSGVSRYDAALTCAHGFIAKGDWQPARKLVEEQAGELNPAQAAYLSGLWRWAARERASAREQFETVLIHEPRHELARLGLARVLEESYDFAAALPHYAALAAVSKREAARVDLARILRKLNRLSDARTAFPPPAAPEDASSVVALELAEIELESGSYRTARGWFEQAHVEEAHFAETLRAAATTFGLDGAAVESAALFRYVDDAQAHSRHISETSRRLALDATDRAAAAELRILQQNLPAPANSPLVDKSASGPGASLFAQHCAACHGATAAGDGLAARNLFPRPRNLRREPLRLVSTLNGVATHADIERVIRLGIPGTSMPSFERLSPEERSQLATHVQETRLAGRREQVVARLREAGDPIDEAEVRQVVADAFARADVLNVPEIEPASPASVARGRDLYLEIGCARCHGEAGTGDAELLLFDDVGQATSPRDLVHDPLKGGFAPEEIYKRIRLGMPGTPHPAAPNLSVSDLIALVHYCRSLSAEPQRARTNRERALRAARSPAAIDYR